MPPVPSPVVPRYEVIIRERKVFDGTGHTGTGAGAPVAADDDGRPVPTAGAAEPPAQRFT